MNAEIISVGTELLLGEILNTDAQFISAELSELGIDVFYQTVVGDNAKRLHKALEAAVLRSDIVIVSGGLGPTQDDITKEVISDFFKKELVMDKESLSRMEKYLAQKGLSNVKCNEKQAMLPRGSVILPNNCGTAPGCIIEDKNSVVIMLPGPPAELQAMFTESVRPYLIKKSGDLLYSENLKIFGMGESKVAELLDKFIKDYENPTVAPYAESPGVRLRITAKAKTKEDATKKIAPVKEEIKKILGDVIYNETGETLQKTVVDLLIKKNMTISAAESCTGGMFSKMITDIAGTSAILNESYVTYANEAKTKILGVLPETLEKYGAVSEQTAQEMADGLYRVSKSNICAVFTGIAGPDGGTKQKPVGLVYAGVCINGKTKVYKLQLQGSRDKIRHSACLEVFNIIRKNLI